MTIRSNDTGAVTVSPATRTFTTTNYSDTQTVTVTPVTDSDSNDERKEVTLTLNGGGFNNRQQTMRVHVADDDNTDTLVSNWLQNPENINAARIAQRFTTGDHADGYDITTISTLLGGTPGGGTFDPYWYEMLIRENNNGNTPGRIIATMVNPSSFRVHSSDIRLGALNTWTAPSEGVALKANTTYWVEVGQRPTSFFPQREYGILRRAQTRSGNEDPTNDSSWSLENQNYLYSAYYGNRWILNRGWVAMIQIKGEERTTPPPVGKSIIGNPNNKPSISGSAQVAKTLTAGVSNLSNPDDRNQPKNDKGNGNIGNPVYTYDYQWQRQDADTGAIVDVNDGFGKSYVVKLEDQSHKLRVQVWLTDERNNRSGPYTSSLTGFVAATTCIDGFQYTQAEGLEVTAVGGSLTSFSPTFSSTTHNYTAWASQGTTALTYDVQLSNKEAHLREVTSSRRASMLDGWPVYVDKALFHVTDYRGGSCYRSTYRVATYTPQYTGVRVQGETAPEGATEQLAFAVMLRPAASEQVSVEYTTSDGTATAGADYVADSGTLIFEPGDTEKVVLVQLKDDDVVEGDETVTLTLSNPSGAAFVVGTATGLIKDSNVSAAGAPTISGTARVGETLTAESSGMSDANGMTNATFSYQWIRNDGSEDSEIAGATARSYSLVEADEGQYIKVKVSFTDDANHDEELTSVETSAVARRPNRPASGAPNIVGSAHVAQTLSAEVSKVVDADGIDNATFMYQWIRSDGTDDTDIAGESNDTYSLQAADEGNHIKLRVTFTDDAGYEETLTSSSTEVVKYALISGTAEVGETLRVDTSTISDPDGMVDAIFSYQWISSDGTTTSEISGATASTYTLKESDIGSVISVLVSYTDDADNDEQLTSAATAMVAWTPVWAATMATADVYQDFGYVNLDGYQSGSLTADSFVADGTTYTVKLIEASGWFYIGLDKEMPFTFRLEVDGVKLHSSDATHSSYSSTRLLWWEDQNLYWDYGDRVSLALYRIRESSASTGATGSPTIGGTAQVGQTLTADTSGISDDDGLTNVSYEYQWIRNDGSTDTDISGASASTYTLVDADEGKTIKVKVNFTDDAGNDEELTSVATAAVAAAATNPLTGFTVVDTSGRPQTVLGTLSDGGTLTLDDPANGSYGIRVDIESGAAIGSVRLQLSGGKSVDQTEGTTPYSLYGDGGEGALNGQSLPVGSYTLTATAYSERRLGGDQLGTLTVFFTVAAANRAPTGAVTISGTAKVGQTLTANISGISDADGLTNVSYAYQWIANDGASDTGIQNATGSTYTILAADEGDSIKVKVSFTDDAGHSETLTSEATEAVSLAVQRQQANSAATGTPTITGTAQVGQTLTADTSGISDADGLTNVSYEYQWIRNGSTDDSDISGAASSSYTLVDADRGKTVKVRVSFTDDADNDEELTSAATSSVAARPNSPATGTVAISGTAQVAGTLTVDTSGISDADGLTNVSYTYQWIRNDGTDDSNISGATSNSYTLVGADQGKNLKVKVSFTDDAGYDEELTSTPTAAVAKPRLTAIFANMPSSHGGQNAFVFELKFSEDFGVSYRTLRDSAFTVTNGAVTKARRLERPASIRWEITVVPDSNGTVTVELPVTTDCAAQGAICTRDGRKLSESLDFTVFGPN